MVVIDKRIVENEKKIIVLEAVSVYVKDIFEHAVEVTGKHEADEYRLRLNGKDLVFDKSITYKELCNQYLGKFEPKVENNTGKLTKAEYWKMEHGVES